MVLNRANNIMLGNTEVQKVYFGSCLVWERKKPEYDRDKIAVVELDSSLNPTGNITYFKTPYDAGMYVYRHQESSYAVYIGEDAGITAIENWAFSECGNLKQITIPDTITEIGYSAFYLCGIKDFQLHSKELTIGGNAFAASQLESISLSGVISAGSSMFYQCSSLRHVEFNGLEISSYMFEDCTSLESISIGNHVTTIGYRAFWGCELLESVDFPDSVMTIGDYIFIGCSSLRTISIGSGIQSINVYAFRDIYNLETITIHLPEDGVPGQKWGASSSVSVIWTG